MQKQFRRFAEKTSLAVGTPWAFMTAIGLVAAWAVSGAIQIDRGRPRLCADVLPPVRRGTAIAVSGFSLQTPTAPSR